GRVSGMSIRAFSVVAFTPAGRFPTVAHDPGAWWGDLASEFPVVRFSANAAWWKVVCSPGIAPLVAGFHRPWRATALKRSGLRAASGLNALRRKEVFDNLSDYIAAASAIGDHITLLNDAQKELAISLEAGARVRGLSYDDSRSLVLYSRRETLLSATIELALRGAQREIDLLVVSITSPEELLTAMVAVRKLRLRHPALHACLADHGYENFSLSFHLARLRTAGTLDSVFDSIVESKDERDSIVPRLARSLARGKPPRGFLRSNMLPGESPSSGHRSTYSAAPPVPTFAPEPVLSTRFSSRRCYWSRCAYCVQNNKYDGAQTPSLAEIPAALERFEQLQSAGYRTLVLGDEALSPTVLARLSDGIVERGITLSWCCRAKIELAFTPALFRRMRQAGCCEVLFGLESISPRMLKRMDKFVEGLTRQRIKAILENAAAAGIGVHVNLIAGFPGDTLAEVTASVDFLSEALAPLPHATYALNEFALFPETPVMRNSEFGVEPIAPDGDMPLRHDFRCAPGLEANHREIERQVPSLRLRLARGLGWDRLGEGPGADAARWLYFGSGHGALFKQKPDSIFSNPLRYVASGTGAGDEEPLQDARLRMLELPMVHSESRCSSL
ncbi:MAG TPA: radical SAM protein, partial [Gammaproteobacteria bacterium]|nr:radical SAM protein [Gammaproteobacteria bacterium]